MDNISIPFDKRDIDEGDINEISLNNEVEQNDKIKKSENLLPSNEAKPVDKVVVTVNLPELSLGELKQAAKAFAEAAKIVGKFEEIENADISGIEKIIGELVNEAKKNLNNDQKYAEVATAWLEKMVHLYERSAGRFEKHVFGTMEKTLGKLDKLVAAFKLEEFKEVAEKVTGTVEKPFEGVGMAFSAISLVWMLMEGSAHMTRGALLSKLKKELVQMKTNLENMPAGQDKINLQKGIQSLEYYLQESRAELVQEVFSYLIDYGKDAVSISKKVMGMIVKTLSPKASLGFAAAGAGLMAIQKSYALYRGIQTQLGIKKFHESAQQREATYDLGDQGTKELYLKRIIKNEDKKFVEHLGLDMVDLDYTSAASIYDALKERGLKLDSKNVKYIEKDKEISIVSNLSGKTFPTSKELYIFLKGKVVLEEIAVADLPRKAELEKEHRSLLNQREKILQNREARFKLLGEMKKFACECNLWIKDKSFVNEMKKESKNEIKSAEALYGKLGEKQYSLKPSQIISEGKFPTVYYLTGPNVFGGYPLKMRINKEMAIFLRYQASSPQEKTALQKEYDKVMKDPLQAQEVLRDFRAILQNESARSVFIQNKVEGDFKEKIDGIKEEIQKKSPEEKFDSVSRHSNLQDPQKLYDHLVGSSSLRMDQPLYEIKLPVSIQIDTGRLYKKGDQYYFKVQEGDNYPLTKEMYDFLLSRGNIVPEDRHNFFGKFQNFLQDEFVSNTLLHDAAMAQVRKEMIMGANLEDPNSFVNKRKIAEQQKIERSENLLPTVLQEIEKASPQEKLQKLKSKGFHLEALLEHDGKSWKIEGYKEKISDDLAKLISPQKVIQKNLNDIKYAIISSEGLSSKMIETAKNELVKEKNKVTERLDVIEVNLKKKEIKVEEKQQLQQEKLSLKRKELSLKNMIDNLGKMPNEKQTIVAINKEINEVVNKWWDNKTIPKESLQNRIDALSEKTPNREFVINQMKQEWFLTALTVGSPLRKWLEAQKDGPYALRYLETLASKKQTFLDALEMLEEITIQSEKPIDVSKELGEVLSDNKVQETLATRRGEGIDTRNTLFKQMTKVVKTEKIRQERIFNAHKVRANFVGLLGGVALSVIGILAIVGVIGLASSVIGLAVVGFGLLMVGVGLMILKAKKPNLYKATMRGVPFRLAFNKMKESWNTMRQTKIEKKPFFDRAEVELISAKSIPKAEVDRFLRMVELNKGNLPPWEKVSPPMQRMIAAIRGVSVEKLGLDWGKEDVKNLILEIEKQSSRQVSTTVIDNFVLRLTESLSEPVIKVPDWDTIDSKLKPLILKILGKDEETIKEHWKKYYQVGKKINEHIGKLIEDLNKAKVSLQKTYATYNKLEDRLYRQQERMVTHKARLDLAAENDFALNLAQRMGMQKGFDLGALAWDEIIAGEGAEDNDLAEFLNNEMGIDLKKMFKGKEGLQREVMEDEFQKGFLGFLGMEGRAFVEKMHRLEEQIQNDFANPVQIKFNYGKGELQN